VAFENQPRPYLDDKSKQAAELADLDRLAPHLLIVRAVEKLRLM
jgi:hypothetical protein